MSLKTLVQKVGQEIAKIWTGTVNELEKVILPAVNTVTNALKNIVDADTSDILGHLAGSAGAALEDKVRTILDKIVPELQLAQQFLTSGADSATILANIVKLLGNSPAVVKTAFYIEFSGKLATALAGGDLTAGEATILAQWFYTNYPATSTAPTAAPATT